MQQNIIPILCYDHALSSNEPSLYICPAESTIFFAGLFLLLATKDPTHTQCIGSRQGAVTYKGHSPVIPMVGTV